jgi:hypothetical protein
MQLCLWLKISRSIGIYIYLRKHRFQLIRAKLCSTHKWYRSRSLLAIYLFRRLVYFIKHYLATPWRVAVKYCHFLGRHVTGPDQGFLVSPLILTLKPWERGCINNSDVRGEQIRSESDPVRSDFGTKIFISDRIGLIKLLRSRIGL